MRELKEKLSDALTRYTLAGFLVMAVLAIPGIFRHPYERMYTFGTSAWDSVIVILIGLWGVSVAYVASRFIVNGSFRERALRKISGIRERDEREELLVGRASKAYVLFNFAVLLILLFASTFHYRVTREGTNSLYTVTIGHFDFSQPAQISASQEAGREIREYTNPVSNTALILFLLCLQIFIFRGFFRRLESKGMR